METNNVRETGIEYKKDNGARRLHEYLFLGTEADENLENLVTKAVHDIITSNKLSGKRIFLKPNLTFITPKSGVTTTIKLLDLITNALINLNCKVVIGEGDAGAYAWTTKESYKNHKIDEICLKYNVEFIHLSDLDWKYLKYEDGKKYQIEVIDDFSSIADATISLPVIKTHAMTGISLALKNLWGMVPSPMRLLNHEHIDSHLPRLAEYYNLVGGIYDGLVSLDGNGPMYGEPIPTNIILWSTNPIKGDIKITQMMGIDPSKVKHLVSSAKFAGIKISDVKDTGPSYEIGSFNPIRTKLNLLEYLTFKSSRLSKLVFTSKLSGIIYWMFNRLKSADERNLSPKEKYSNDPRRIQLEN